MSGTVGRFAPSPSGRLHLGNLACSLLAWLSAKHQGGKIVLRIEDLDAERCPRKYADQLEEDLSWLGLVWDEGGSHGGPHGPYYQSECAPVYEEAYAKLAAQGLVYPCFCSRSQLHAASAPHTSDGNVIYPGTCRDLTPEEIAEKRKHKAPAYRVRVPDENVRFVDGCMGPHTENLLRDCGDFYLRRADGVFAYQLAVVVDDARMGVTEVVRGADLLSSTARQLYLYRLLGLKAPRFAHCPLPGPGWPPPLQAGWRPEPGKPPCQVHGGGDRGQAGLCVWSAARACSPHTGEPCYRFQLGECAQRRSLPAGKFILTKNACSLTGAGVFGSIRQIGKITGAPARGWCRCPGGSWPSRGQGPAECPSSRQCSCAA